MKLLANKATATEVITHDVAPLTVNTNANYYTRLGWIVTLVGFVGFLLWATFAPLDKGVPLSGTVAKESNRKAIQHQMGGTIDDILVKEGDLVKAGQVLLRMNAVVAKSGEQISRVQLNSARAAEARLLAERAGKADLQFPKELLDQRKSDPRVAANMDNQLQLFRSRHDSLHNELSAISDSILGLQMQNKGMQASRESKKAQLEILKEQLTNMRDLAKDGYVPRARLLEMERANVQLLGQVAEDTGNIGRGEQQAIELARRRDKVQQEFQKDVSMQLTDVQRDVESLTSRLVAQEFELNNTEVKAPVDGIVVGVNVFTRGGVVPPGYRLMDLVPVNDAMVVEGQLAVNLIDKVHKDMPVDLIFSAFNSSSTPHIPGKIIQVGADRLVDEHSGAPYYKVKVIVTPEGTKKIVAHKLNVQPGMPVDMFVKTGSRSMMSYLFKPVMDRAITAFTED